MDTVKTFFAGQAKDGALSNNQQNGGFGLFGGRSIMQSGNGLTNCAVSGNAGGKIADHHDVKRKDSDSYFYIMWRS